MKIEQFEARVETLDGDIVINAERGMMVIRTTGIDDDKGHLIFLTPRKVLELKGAIAAFEKMMIENRW